MFGRTGAGAREPAEAGPGPRRNNMPTTMAAASLMDDLSVIMLPLRS